MRHVTLPRLAYQRSITCEYTVELSCSVCRNVGAYVADRGDLATRCLRNRVQANCRTVEFCSGAGAQLSTPLLGLPGEHPFPSLNFDFGEDASAATSSNAFLRTANGRLFSRLPTLCSEIFRASSQSAVARSPFSSSMCVTAALPALLFGGTARARHLYYVAFCRLL